MRSNIDPLLNKKIWLPKEKEAKKEEIKPEEPKVYPFLRSDEDDLAHKEKLLDKEFAEQRFLLAQYWNQCADKNLAYQSTVSKLHDGFVRASTFKMTPEEKRELVEDIKAVNAALERSDIQANLDLLNTRSQRVGLTKADWALIIGGLMAGLATLLLMATMLALVVLCPPLAVPAAVLGGLYVTHLATIAVWAALTIAQVVRSNCTLFGQQIINGRHEKELVTELGKVVAADTVKEAPKVVAM